MIVYQPLSWLADQRARMRLTQRQAAERCGVSPAAWASWESGVRRPSPRIRARICAALGLDELDPGWHQEVVSS